MNRNESNIINHIPPLTAPAVMTRTEYVVRWVEADGEERVRTIAAGYDYADGFVAGLREAGRSIAKVERVTIDTENVTEEFE